MEKLQVLQIDKNTNLIIKEYPSTSEAKRQTGINGISNVVNNPLKTAGGFIWRYV